MDDKKRIDRGEIVQALRCHADCQKTCDPCVFVELMETDENCTTVLCTAAADLIEEYVDRCARFSEEIMELRERLQKIEQPGGCAFAPWCDAVREQRRWIPVEERLPERTGPVLVYYGFTEGDEISEQRFFGVMDYYAVDPKPHFQHDGYRGLTVTHWRPLPPAPEDA